MPIGKGNVNKPNPLTEGKTRAGIKPIYNSPAPVRPPVGTGETSTKTDIAYAEASIPEDKPFDSRAFLMAYEGGELSDDEIIDGFQHLLDSGLAWSLQGSYGRTAKALIDAGYIHA